MLSSDSPEKYKKSSCFKQPSQRDIQNIYFSKESHASSSFKSDRFFNKITHIIPKISPKSNSLRSIFLNREKLQNKTEVRENKVAHTNNFETFLTSSNAYQNESSQDVEKFMKNNKLLFFTSRKQKTNNSFHDPKMVSFYLNNSTKQESKQERFKNFNTNESLSPQTKQNLDQSHLNKINRISLNYEQISSKKTIDNTLKRKSTLITSLQEKNRFLQNTSLHQQMRKLRMFDQDQINQPNLYQDNIKDQEKGMKNNSKNQEQFQDTIIGDIYQPILQKQTTLQTMINRMHIKQPIQQPNEPISYDNYVEDQSQEQTPLSASKSPLSKKLDLINLRFAQIENEKTQKSSYNQRENSYQIKNYQKFQTMSPQSHKYKQNRNIRSEKSLYVQKSLSSFHKSSFHTQSIEQNQQQDNTSTTKKIPLIKNLTLTNEKIKNQFDSETPYDNSIQSYQQFYQPKKIILQKGYMTHTHDQLQSIQKSPIKNFNLLYSQTPAVAAVSIQENENKESQDDPIQPLDHSKKNLTNLRSSNIFSNYVALTFKNNLLELRKRAQNQIIQKLSFESRQALKRLVIYINDMTQEYENIKKVSQTIYQLVYHIPYLVKMLFKNKKILLRDKIDLPFVTRFLTNRTNMGYIENKTETFDEMLDNKIKIDIVFLNERLMEFIQKKFQDRFTLITKSIIEEHEKVQNLEEKIEEKIAKTRGQIPNVDKQLLKNKHNYQCVDNYMFHSKQKNQNTFAQTFLNSENRLGYFHIIDRQNVIINNELDNIYTQVQNQTTNKSQMNPFQDYDEQQLQKQLKQEIQDI